METEHRTTAALYGRVSRVKTDRDKADRERSVDQQDVQHWYWRARYVVHFDGQSA